MYVQLRFNYLFFCFIFSFWTHLLFIMHFIADNSDKYIFNEKTVFSLSGLTRLTVRLYNCNLLKYALWPFIKLCWTTKIFGISGHKKKRQKNLLTFYTNLQKSFMKSDESVRKSEKSFKVSIQGPWIPDVYCTKNRLHPMP